MWNLIRAFGDLSLAWSASAARLQATGVSPAVAQGVETARREKSADDALETLAKHGGRAIAWHDPAISPTTARDPRPSALDLCQG